MRSFHGDIGTQIFGNGEITVFLSLILLLIISFLMGLAQSAWIYIARSEARSLAEMAMESVFGEYRTELLDEYELFFLDGGYRTGQYEEEAVLRHYRSYLDPWNGEKASYGKAVNWNLTLESMGLTAVQLATDDQGAAVREQISNYMQAHTGLELLQSLLGQEERILQQMDHLQDDGAEYARSDRENESLLEELEAEREQLGIDPETGNSQENPLKDVEYIKGISLLDLVMPEGETVSQKELDLAGTVSHRTLRKGYGEAVWRVGRKEGLDRMLFYGYLLEQLQSFAGVEKSDMKRAAAHQLDYELEYLIMGKGGDRQNLQAVVDRLLLIREGTNFACLLTDGAKQAEAEALAAAIAGTAGVPVLIEALKWALLLAWAYGESILDLRILLNGGKVGLVKTSAAWHLNLADLASLQMIGVPQGEPNGITYREWLLMLLVAGNTSMQTMRFCDLAEANIRLEQGNSGFCMDDCISGMTVEMTWNTGRGIQYSFPQSYGYH